MSSGSESPAPDPVTWIGRAPFRYYALAALLVGMASALGKLGHPWLDLPDLVLIYLLVVVIAAARFGRGPSLLATALSVLAFDFFFVPPTFTLLVAEKRFVLTF